MGRATASTTTTPTGLDGLLGGRAKSGIVRALADRGALRLTDLIGAVGMSKSAVTNALTQLEESGAVRTHREGREVLVEATERALFVTLISFDRRAHHEALTMPVPQEDLSDDVLTMVEAFLAADGAVCLASTSAVSHKVLGPAKFGLSKDMTLLAQQRLVTFFSR